MTIDFINRTLVVGQKSLFCFKHVLIIKLNCLKLAKIRKMKLDPQYISLKTHSKEGQKTQD